LIRVCKLLNIPRSSGKAWEQGYSHYTNSYRHYMIILTKPCLQWSYCRQW